MNYSVFVLRRAQKGLAALPQDVYPRMRDRLLSLADEPRPPGTKRLVGRGGSLPGELGSGAALGPLCGHRRFRAADA